MKILGAALGLALLVSPASAEDADELRQRAQGLANEEKWAEAAEVYESLTASDPKDIQSWAQLGRMRRSLDQLDGAVAAYEKALALDDEAFLAHAGLAITLERMEKVDRAFDHLEKLAELGAPPQMLQENPVFAGLREHERFTVALGIAERAANPCHEAGPHDDFDFWVGDWDVYSNGRKGARNVITKEMNGCFVRESYSGGGTVGESINYYDPETGRWKQNWVDSTGGIVRYTGGLTKEGVMKMEGANTTVKGVTKRARVTWTRLEDGRVHHLIEHSTDGGKTWTPAFDAIYKKHEEGGE